MSALTSEYVSVNTHPPFESRAAREGHHVLTSLYLFYLQHALDFGVLVGEVETKTVIAYPLSLAFSFFLIKYTSIIVNSQQPLKLMAINNIDVLKANNHQQYPSSKLKTIKLMAPINKEMDAISTIYPRSPLPRGPKLKIVICSIARILST